MIFNIYQGIAEALPAARILLPLLTSQQTASMDNESSSSGGGGGGGGIVHVTTTHLLATALPLLLIAVAGHHFDLGVENGLMVGVARSFVQLMILGMILQPIFVLGMDMSWVVGLCE
jgi:hypothetical protein